MDLLTELERGLQILLGLGAIVALMTLLWVLLSFRRR